MWRIIHIAVLMLATTWAMHAQPVDELIRRAYMKFNEKDYLAAAADIDEVVSLKKGEVNELAWHIRGFIYKDIYLHEDQGNMDSEARDVSVYSLLKSVELDEDQVLYINNEKALRHLAASYFNDATDVINERDPSSIDRADELYGKFRDISLHIEPDSVVKSRDIDFFLAMATAHRKIYEQKREENIAHYDKANAYYKKVLDIDPDNWPALYSIGVNLYNKGAYNLEKLPELDIHDIIRTEGESIRSIQFALPFMTRAYEVNPERIEAVKGLKYIHFNLNDIEKSEFFEKEHERLRQEQKD